MNVTIEQAEYLLKLPKKVLVPGYKTLAWAIPLVDDDFEIKTIETNDFNSTLKDIILFFAKTVNIETVITINTILI